MSGSMFGPAIHSLDYTHHTSLHYTHTNGPHARLAPLSHGGRLKAVRIVGAPRAWRQSVVLAGGEHFLDADLRRGSQSSGAHSLAGMILTSTCVCHVTDRERCRQTSTCGLQLTDREGFCWGLLSGAEGRTELQRRDDSLDTVRVLLELVQGSLDLRGFGGIWGKRNTDSML
ncbi:hypothetical protein T484DRAFT_1748987 [Baffinella frigidus]|nr:hypothetical protein T484DRAFT_1748987 [Cryptophyta sp. CCMP2293]